MTSDTSQAKSVVLIQWGLVTGSGSISRSAYLCLNHFFLNYQHLPGFPQALYLCLGSLFHIYQWIRHRKNRQQLSRGWKHHYKSHFYKYWCTVVFTWAGERQEFGIWTWTPGFYSTPLWANHTWRYKVESAYGRKNQINLCRSC